MTMTTKPRPPKHHDIFLGSEYFSHVRCRNKTFELTLNDRDYRVGDTIRFAGDEIGQMTESRMIKYVLTDAEKYGLRHGYCIFGW